MTPFNRLCVMAVSGGAVVLALAASPLMAQEAEPGADQFQATQELITDMQKRIDRLNAAASSRDKQLDFLNGKIAEAIQQITGGRRDNQTLQGRNSAYKEEIQTLSDSKESLGKQISRVTSEREVTLAQLREQLTALTSLLDSERQATTRLSEERNSLSAKLRDATNGREAAEARLEGSRKQQAEAMATRDRRIAQLVAAAERDAQNLKVARNGIAERDRRVAELMAAAEGRAKGLTDVETAVAARDRRIAELEAASEQDTASLDYSLDLNEKLTRQLADLKDRLALLNTDRDIRLQRLAEREAALALGETRVAELERELLVARAASVGGLKEYRSEFFGRLRTALGDRPDIRVVGDRFVFQSEVLFGSGSALLDRGGEETLRKLAESLAEVARRIPQDVNWFLRIDGHTDRVPIHTERFDSNWDLSSARAIAVLRYLIGQGVAPNHLGAMGFGEFQPLDQREDEIAYRRNRRIEFKLTQR